MSDREARMQELVRPAWIHAMGRNRGVKSDAPDMVNSITICRSGGTPLSRLEVVAAVFVRGGKILACRRAPGKSAAGKWEFPGGKVEDGETPEVALVREIQEELGTTISVDALVDRSVTPIGDLDIDLACYLVKTDEVATHSTDHDELRWVPIDSLPALDWAAPDLPAVAVLTSGAYRSQLEQNS